MGTYKYGCWILLMAVLLCALVLAIVPGKLPG